MKVLFLVSASVACSVCASAISRENTYINVEDESGYVHTFDADEILEIRFEDPDTIKPMGPRVSVSGRIDGITYVDLGLPSGNLWATYNVGAKEPVEFGSYFAWGEVEPKSEYSWENYKWCDGEKKKGTKYVWDEKFGTVDSLIVLLPEDDAATVNWGENWRMPTKEDFEELFKSCTWSWAYEGGNGRLGKSKYNNRKIFLPSAGYWDGTDCYDSEWEIYGRYWSASIDTSYTYSRTATSFYFQDDSVVPWDDCCVGVRYDDSLYQGFSVRAVVNK